MLVLPKELKAIYRLLILLTPWDEGGKHPELIDAVRGDVSFFAHAGETHPVPRARPLEVASRVNPKSHLSGQVGEEAGPERLNVREARGSSDSGCVHDHWSRKEAENQKRLQRLKTQAQN